MRSTEFLKEAPARYDDSGNELSPAPGTVGAAQADAARIAQGQKNLNAIKGFFGMKPEELKDAPPGFSIDPVQRARMGYKPATQQEIAAFQAANPNYGKLVDREGNPIKSGTPGVTWDAGGEKAVVQTAQAAAPETKGAAHIGMTPNVPTDVGRHPGEAHAGQGGSNYQEPAPAAPQAAQPDDSAARAYAAADANRRPITAKDSGDKGTTPLTSPAELQKLAGIPPAAAQAAAPAQEPAAAPPAYTGLASAPAAEPAAAAEPPAAAAEVPAAEPAPVAAPPAYTGLASAPAAKKSAPAAKKAAPRISPAIVGYASRMGLYKNGKPDPAAIKAFQKKNGLKPADGIIGPNTSNAILSAAMPGRSQGNPGQATPPTGSPMPPQPARPVPPAVMSSAAAPAAPAAPRRDTSAQRQLVAKTVPGAGAQAAQPAVKKESNDLARMRFLAGLS